MDACGRYLCRLCIRWNVDSSLEETSLKQHFTRAQLAQTVKGCAVLYKHRFQSIDASGSDGPRARKYSDEINDRSLQPGFMRMCTDAA